MYYNGSPLLTSVRLTSVRYVALGINLTPCIPYRMPDDMNEKKGQKLYVYKYFFILMCTEGIPHDGIPEEEIVTIHTSVTVIFVLLASAGVVFTVACLLFNFVFRKRK